MKELPFGEILINEYGGTLHFIWASVTIDVEISLRFSEITIGENFLQKIFYASPTG